MLNHSHLTAVNVKFTVQKN